MQKEKEMVDSFHINKESITFTAKVFYHFVVEFLSNPMYTVREQKGYSVLLLYIKSFVFFGVIAYYISFIESTSCFKKTKPIISYGYILMKKIKDLCISSCSLYKMAVCLLNVN